MIAAATQAAEPAKTAPASPAEPLLNQWLHSRFEATEPWDIGGEARARYEVKENAGSFPNRDFVRSGLDNSNDYLLLRQKFHVGYDATDWLAFYTEGRNSTSHSDDRSPSADEDSMDLHQAYLELGDAKQFPLTLKIGRQGVSYGEERVFGVSDWSNTGRIFDAAKLRYTHDAFWVDLLAAHPVIPVDDKFNEMNDNDFVGAVYAGTKSLIPKMESELYFVSRNVSLGSPSPTAPRDIYSVGTRLKSLPGQFGGWDFSTEVIGQFGSINSGGTRVDHRAMLANFQAGHIWKDTFGTPRLGVEYSYGSGDDDPTDDKNTTFDLLFGTNHRVYGLMDLFGPRNLHSPSLNFSIKPHKALTLRAEALAYWMVEMNDLLYPESAAGRTANGYGRNPQYDRYVGSEVNLVATYKPASWLDVQLGYGHFFVGSYIEQSLEAVPANQGATDADWLYAQARITF